MGHAGGLRPRRGTAPWSSGISALAQRIAARVDAAADLERLADVPLDIVCFRFRPPAVAEADLDALNTRLGELVLQDGRVYVGTTRYDGRVAFRPAIVNWLTTEADVDLLVDVIRELGASLVADARRGREELGAALAQRGGLAHAVAQEVQLGAPGDAVTHDLDLVDARRVDLEGALHADAAAQARGR